MKTISTKIDGQRISVRLQNDCPPKCDYESCRRRGRVYCCYTDDFKNCGAYVPIQNTESAILFGNMLSQRQERGGRGWNQL